MADLELAVRNARRVLALVNQLLDLAKLESGQMALQARPGDLGALVRDVASSFRPLVDRRRIILSIEVPESPLDLWYDPRLMEEATSNLLSNAAKFTPEGGAIRVRLAAEDNEGGTACAVLRVTDTGPGIPVEHLGRIFDRFYHVGGRIGVESDVGHGATFSVSLPLGRAHLRNDQIVQIVAAPPAAADDGAPEAAAIAASSGAAPTADGSRRCAHRARRRGP